MLAGSDAAPARGRRTLLPLPGGAGAPPAGTRTRRERLLTAGLSARVRLEVVAAQKGAAPESRRRGDVVVGSATRRRTDAAMARREAPRAGNGTCPRPNDAPLGAPSPRYFEGRGKLVPAKAGRKTAYPAPQRIRAAEGWLYPPHPEEIRNQCSRNSPLMALSSAGLISLQCATCTECSGPSSFSCQNSRNFCSSGNFGNRSYACQT